MERKRASEDTHFLESAEGCTSQNMEGSDRVKVTHPLESAEGWTSQVIERKRESDRHSLPGEHRGMD
jgi:hypothetical protein